MKAESIKFQTVEEYMSALPPVARKILKELRKTIKQAAPKAEEAISYNIPAFKLHGVLIYYAAWKDHISIYPRTAGLEKAFKKELAPFEGGKGTIKFPIDQPIPYDLVNRMVKFRVQENMDNAAAKAKAKAKQ
ncbi:MAG TPA: DUF1801 domain-containing protein [Chitinophagaceae bacterium]|nr:DUF1801 domain-containing protein [Chitinophagaceae bacterium]